MKGIFKNKVVVWSFAIILVAFIILVAVRESKKPTVSTWDSFTDGLDQIFR